MRGDQRPGLAAAFRALRLELLAGLLALTWPALNFLSSNFGIIRSDGANFAAIGIFTLAAICFVSAVALTCACFGQVLAAWRALFVVVALFPPLFVFQPATATLASWLQPLTTKARLVGELGFLLTWCVAGLAAWRLGGHRPILTIFTVLLAVANLLPAASIAFRAVSTHSAVQSVGETERLVPASARGRRDIFYIIFDSYPGLNVTDKYFGIDNRGIAALLAKKGFFSAGDFQSDYFATYLTFTAILNARYTVTDKTAFPLDMNDFYPNILQRPDRLAAVEAFRHMGYQPYFIGNWYGRCKPGLFACLKQQAYWLDETMSSFLSNTPWPTLVSRFANRAFDGDWDAVNPLIRSLPELMAAPGLKFVLAHNIPPHPPAIYNADCSPAENVGSTGLAWQYGKAPYEKNMACVNRKIEKLVGEIIARDPGAIIVIQSDHGSFTSAARQLVPAKISPLTRFEISRPINFIRAPQACARWLYRGMSQINTMRFALACAHDGKPDYLPDISYADMSASADIHGPFQRQPLAQFPAAANRQARRVE